MRDLEIYAKDALAELMHGKTATTSELRSEVEDAEGDFDGDSFCPYYNQQADLISEYERDFGRDAEDICDGGQEFKASEYQQAMTAYAYAVGWAAFSSFFAQAKEECNDAFDDIEAELTARDLDPDEAHVSVSSSDPFGWSAHDREDSTVNGNTLYIHESRQLDGINGVSMRVWNGMFLSFTWEPKAETEGAE